MEKKKHIAMLIGTLNKGGAERVMVNLADYFVEKGYAVTLVTQYQAETEYPLNPKVKRVFSEITQEEVTGNRIINFKRRFCKLRNIWIKERPDVILSFIGKNNMMAILTSRGLGIPVAVSVRGEPGEEYYNRIMRIGAKKLFALADGVILQTKQCFEFFPVNVQKKAVILRNPVSKSFFRERYEGEREKIIVSVGRVDANKNHEMLIRAFSGIAEQFPDYRVIIYGEGECREKLINLTKKLKLSERILLPGNIEDVAEAIYKTRVFVLTSDTEGSPNTLIEAMIMGLTVIATDCPCGGPADLISDWENGILTPVRDVDGLQENLQKVLSDLQKADELGVAARKTGDIYREERVYREWEEFLCNLIRKSDK
ncbi:MAG: glycosyltransferase [Lachnospiraceae bacterium]|nr:glycosyltransferase [Lachnospiraceae bacterium]